MRGTLALMLLLAGGSSAFAAEAVTYTGTLGNLPIVVELNETDGKSEFDGRFAYLSKGGDIPLRGKIRKDGRLVIKEEAPCTPAICQNKDGETLEVAPIGANWTLARKGDDTLAGEWRDSKSGKVLKIELTRKGARDLADDASGLDRLDPARALPMTGNDVITPEDLPYDFIKTAYGIKQGPASRLGDVEFRMDSDPRTELSFPTFLKVGREDVAKVNEWAMQRRVQSSLNAFSCLSTAYLGFNWAGIESQGTNGNFDGVTTEVEYATERLIIVKESGSYYCGGAHPDHYMNRYFVDVRTGESLRSTALLKGFVAKNYDGQEVIPTEENQSEITWAPNDALVDYIVKRKGTITDIDEKECGLPDLIKSNLGVYVSGSDLIFTLDNLPHVIFACTTDIVKVPLKEARTLLTDKGIGYFRELE